MSRTGSSHGGDAPAPEDRLDVLFIRVAGTRWAVEAGYVGHIVETFDVHPVPRTPSAVTGMTDVESEVAAVIDAGAVVDPDRSPGETAGPLVTLHREEGDGVGLRVDRVDDLANVDVSRVEPIERDDDGAAGEAVDRELPTDPSAAGAAGEVPATDAAGEGAGGSPTRRSPAASAPKPTGRWSRALIAPEGDDAGAPVGVLDVPYLLQTVANNTDPRNA